MPPFDRSRNTGANPFSPIGYPKIPDSDAVKRLTSSPVLLVLIYELAEGEPKMVAPDSSSKSFAPTVRSPSVKKIPPGSVLVACRATPAELFSSKKEGPFATGNSPFAVVIAALPSYESLPSG